MNDKITISTFQLFKMFPDQESARIYLESRLWPKGVRCPCCGLGERVTARKGKEGFYLCNQCKEDFTVRTGTIFERSHVPLHLWLIALALIADSPEIPSATLADALGVTQKTGWLILRRAHDAAGEFLAERFMAYTPGFKTLTDWPAYRVGEDGSIWTRYRTGRGGRLGLKWRAMNPSPDKDGYRVVRLYGERGAWKQLRVSILVCAAFNGPCPAGLECRHMNGKCSDDAASNLQWGTSVENKSDMKRHGTQPLGQRHHNATLTDAQVAAIRALKGKRLQREVAVEFGTTQGYVSELWGSRSKRITYKELTA